MQIRAKTAHQCTGTVVKMLKDELKEWVAKSQQPQRAVVLIDSWVVVGAYNKGRTSSRQLDRVLRSMLGWAVKGQKSVHLVWGQSKSNPSDHPSRGRRIPEPCPNDPTIKSCLGQDVPELSSRKSNKVIYQQAGRDMEAHDHIPCRFQEFDDETSRAIHSAFIHRPHVAQKAWTFLEIFAGKGRLTHEFQKRGAFGIAAPIEKIQGGNPCTNHDLLNDKVLARLCAEASRQRQIWHFGPPNIFSVMQNLNGGTRSKARPEGDGSLIKEKRGNELLNRTVHLCFLSDAHRSFSALKTRNCHTHGGCHTWNS